ncbi:bifunctional 2',3'-cyclic-nucleotide 2'-phosphodiesterase/3'-nucleotidase [Brevibacillus sp. SYP-B805]|uniref:bifunctional 2',3'-cyclic-nucleotide 2'-phosphodiesterase/3'-nucleotidase n=1 Tax=Brevibacillus sp. SYP-B805 TaxID=1578199 RepID=UPI0013EC1FC8|nr:bifunctional 2',3'-cyclic-nucleotide 2'-phosphodiesterase/3'-nucleotidase [Brevibacillus sp. SYP-B805]NGQ94278.1 bifunctional 2',3'-cyclic-nucleotide 2'-phosphodiesterase/3'-nucleotidase [Brevibacillus sp. SYP-B805]
MKKAGRQKLVGCLLAVSLTVAALSFPLTPVSAETASTLKLRLLETTDIHTNIVNYDYYQDKATDEFGLAKTATLIKKAREEVTNSLLFDNGDLIQGNPLGDYVAKIAPLKDGETHPVYKAMNLLNYDAGNIGNHEFNYGLEFLQTSLKGSKFPYVNANVYVDDKDQDPSNDKNYFTPYQILERTFKDESGKDVTLKIGVIGFVPPQIMNWDKVNLSGKVIAKDIVETAKKFVPEMKAKGADIIVALAHSGMGPVESSPNLENASYQLSKVDGIDAILFGHSHLVFPGKGFENIAGVDNTKGTINGKAAVMPGFWGDHLGIVDLSLQQVDGKWKVVDSVSQALPIYDKANKKPLADADPAILDAVKEDHEHTIEWVRSAVGTTTAPIYSFFALVQDDPSIQLVTNAQKWYIEKNIQGTEYEGIPILSAGAPFKAGGRGGASYYTNIPAGTIAIKNVSDLYIYPNTVKAVLVNGATVKEWLERSAGQFNQIDKKKTEEQPLINEAFPTYNFDVIDGVTYQIDVTEPARYDIDGKLVNEKANRIKNLQYNGKPVKPEDRFIVVTNNYRAGGGGNFPGLDGSNIVIDSPDENRQVVIDYILANKTINPTADNNWSFAPIQEKVNVTFTTSPDAKPFAEKLSNIKYITTLENGFAKYAIDLSKAQK